MTNDNAEIAISYQPHPSNADEDVEEPTFDDTTVRRYVTTMIVEAHLGTITEQSADGDTTLRIRIPAIPEGA
jgi:hypothetical protein